MTEYIIGGIFIIGIAAVIATVIKYPKDIARGLWATLLLPFERIWNVIRIILIPFELLILFIENKLGVNFMTKFIDRESSSTVRKTKGRKPFNFERFKKYIVINSTTDQVELELNEADECCLEVTITNLQISRTEEYSVIETPENGFYGYNFLIQWLSNQFTKNEIIGFASNGRTKFMTISNPEGDNELIGITNSGQKFWVSMYDDLDEKQFLRLNNEIELNSKLTTESLERIVQKVIS